MHLATQLTENHELNAVRIIERDFEVVRTDGGNEVRNTRWETPLRRFEVAGYHCNDDNADFLSIQEMWEDTEGGVHTFMFRDFVADELVKVRFDGGLQITAPAPHIRKIDTFTLQEVRG
jgi:hypothetical protein